MSTTIARAMIIRGGAIGDCILVLPVLAAIRKRWPECWIDLVAPRRMESLMLGSGLADGFHDIESRSWTGFYIEGGPLDPRCVELISKAQLVLAYVSDADKVFENHLKRSTQGRVTAVAPRPSEESQTHCVDWLLAPLKEVGIASAGRVPRISFSGASEVATGRKILAAHLGSGSGKKNWPAENWSALLQGFLKDTDWELLLVGGESEAVVLRKVARNLSSARVAMAQSLPLDELARRLSACRLFIGHDSGITHLAAALGLPVLAIWGPTNESVWRPLGQSVRLVNGGANLERLPIGEVQTELAEILRESRNEIRTETTF